MNKSNRITKFCSRCGVESEHAADPKFRCVICDQLRKRQERGKPKDPFRVVKKCKDKVDRPCRACGKTTPHYVEEPAHRCLGCDRRRKKELRSEKKQGSEPMPKFRRGECRYHGTTWRYNTPGGGNCRMCNQLHNLQKDAGDKMGEFDEQDQLDILARQGYACALCGERICDRDEDLGHINALEAKGRQCRWMVCWGRIDPDGLYERDNIQAEHTICNHIRDGCPIGDFPAVLEKIVCYSGARSVVDRLGLEKEEDSMGKERYAAASEVNYELARCEQHGCATVHEKRGSCLMCLDWAKMGQKTGAARKMTRADQIEILSDQGFRCAICGGRFRLFTKERPHFKQPMKISWDRIDPSGDYERGNVQATHWVCNKIKFTLDMEEMIALCQRVYRHLVGTDIVTFSADAARPPDVPPPDPDASLACKKKPRKKRPAEDDEEITKAVEARKKHARYSDEPGVPFLRRCKGHGREMWKLQGATAPCCLCGWWRNHSREGPAFDRGAQTQAIARQGEKCTLCGRSLFDIDVPGPHHMPAVHRPDPSAPYGPDNAEIVHDACRGICRPQKENCGSLQELLRDIDQRHHSVGGGGPPQDPRPTVGVEKYVRAPGEETKFPVKYCRKHGCETLHCPAQRGYFECRLCRGGRKSGKKVGDTIELTPQEQLRILRAQEEVCATCGGRFEIRADEDPSTSPPLAICWGRIDAAAPWTIDNIQAVHQRCRDMRDRIAMPLPEWYRLVAIVRAHLFP